MSGHARTARFWPRRPIQLPRQRWQPGVELDQDWQDQAPFVLSGRRLAAVVVDADADVVERRASGQVEVVRKFELAGASPIA